VLLETRSHSASGFLHTIATSPDLHNREVIIGYPCLVLETP
jgi:hypothetical protein